MGNLDLKFVEVGEEIAPQVWESSVGVIGVLWTGVSLW